MTLTWYSLPYLLATALLGALVPSVWRRRTVSGTRAFAVVLLAAAFWCLGTAVEVAAVSLEGKVLAARAEYLGILAIPPAWLLFSLQYTGRIRRVRPWTIGLLTVVPAITVALLWIGGHRLMIYGEELDPRSPSIIVNYGPWFRVMGAYEYALLLVGAGALSVSLAHTQRLFRAQGAMLLLACILPFAANVAHALEVGPLPFLDLTPFMFAVSAAIIALGVVRFRMFDLVPAAREAVIETMPDAVLVLDASGRIVDANPAAARLFGHDGSPLIGRPAAPLLPAEHRHLLAQPSEDRQRQIVEIPDPRRLLEIRVCSIREGPTASGWMALFQDVTEREDLISELQRALGSVRTLSGLIPICASCKKVRDDDGFWQQVEAYLGQHSDARFTHGICPDCAKKLYPEHESRDGAQKAPSGRPHPGAN